MLANNTLKKSNGEFNQQLDKAGIMILFIDSNQIVRMINKKGCEILGYDENEIIGKNWFDNFLPKEIIDEIKMIFNQMIDKKNPGDYFESPILRKNGEERLINWNCSLIFNEDKTVSGVLFSGEDITEQRKAQMEILVKSETMRTLYTISRELSHLTDLSEFQERVANILTKNTTIICGAFYLIDKKSNLCNQTTYFGKNEYNTLFPDSLDLSSIPLKNIIYKEEGHIDELYNENKDKTTKLKRFLIPLQSNKEVLGIMSILLKDSDYDTINFLKIIASEIGRSIRRKIIDSERNLSDQKFHTIFQTGPDPIAISRVKDGTLLEVNEKFLEMTGINYDDIIAEKIKTEEIWENQCERSKLVKELIKKGKISNFETVVSTRNGPVYVLLSASLINYKNSKCMLTVVKDISDRIRSEKETLERNRQISLLYEAGNKLAGTLDLNHLYDRMYEILSQIADCDHLFVATYDDQNKLIKYFYLRTKDSEKSIDVSKIPEIQLAPQGYGILSEVIRTGKSCIIDDYRKRFEKVKTKYVINEEGELESESSNDENSPNSAMLVPIKLDSKIFGIVEIFSKKMSAYTKDQVHFVELLMHQVALANKNVILYQKAQNEIKERKSVEESLRKSEERIRQFSESVPDILYQLDLKNNKFDFLSPSFEKMLGYSHEDTLRDPMNFILNIIYDGDKENVTGKLNEFINSADKDTPFELEARIVKKDNSILWVRNIIRFSWENGNPVGASGIMSDISEKKLEMEKKRLRDEQIIAHQYALLEMSKFTHDSIETSIKNITEIVYQILKIDRTSIWFFNEDRTKLICKDIYECKDKSHNSGMIIEQAECPKFFEFIDSPEDAYKVISTTYLPAIEFIKKCFSDYGTSSLIFTKIMHRGEIAGFICFESKYIDKEDWTQEQKDFTVSTSNIISIALESEERQKAEREISKSLKDKELLLQEIHHRVKNNLAVISSLLYLQTQKTNNKQIIDTLQKSQMRIKSMVLVHEKLYQSKDLSKINYADYVETLTKTLFHTYQLESSKISLELNIKDIYLDTDSATNLGLIINELILNSIKHAFTDQPSGKITISLSLDSDGLYKLVVKDDGKGLPPDFDYNETETLGLKLVSTLVEQIDGKMNVESSNGTAFIIKFAKHV